MRNRRRDSRGLNLAGVAGTLNWLALRPRPDIAWAVSRTARLVARNPPLAYHRFRQVARYPRWTLDLGLKFKPLTDAECSTLWTCADASFAPTGESSHEGMALIQGVLRQHRMSSVAERHSPNLSQQTYFCKG
eukprot:6211752-Amphidinium_carterae.1